MTDLKRIIVQIVYNDHIFELLNEIDGLQAQNFLFKSIVSVLLKIGMTKCLNMDFYFSKANTFETNNIYLKKSKPLFNYNLHF